MNTFKILAFNVMNLFLPSEPGPAAPFKPLEKVQVLGRHLRNLDPDIMILSEVGGPASLDNFNNPYLRNLYHRAIVEGNSSRGIDVGYLIKKSLPFRFQLISHKDRILENPKPQEGSWTSKFSRDVPELRLYLKNEKVEKDSQEPWMIFLAVHLKSKLEKETTDPQGRAQRHAELLTLIAIYQEIHQEFGGRVPIIIGGDFNGNASAHFTDPEFTALYTRTSFKDALEIAGRPDLERITHIHFHPSGLAEKNQLDYVFLPPELHSWVDPQATRVSHFQNPPAFPQTKEEQFLLPSDHYPLMVTLRLEVPKAFA